MLLLVNAILVLLGLYSVAAAPGVPMFTQTPSNVEVADGMSATFVCEAVSTGNTPVAICWFKVAQNNSAQIAIDSTDSRVSTMQLPNKGALSTFTLNNVSVSDATTYLCAAKTDTETITSSANLTVIVISMPQLSISTTSTNSLELISTTKLMGLFDSRSFSAAITLEATSTFVAVSSTQSNSYSSAYAQHSSLLSSTSSIKGTQSVSSTHTVWSSIVPTPLGTPTTSTQGNELPSAQTSISPTPAVHSLISHTQDIHMTQSSTSASAVEIPKFSTSQAITIFDQSMSTDVLTTSTLSSTQLSNALISSVFSTPLLIKSTQTTRMAMSQSFSLVTPTSSLSILQPVETSSERHSITTTPTFYTTSSSTQSMHLFSSGIPAAATDSTQEHSITTHFPSSTITVVPGNTQTTRMAMSQSFSLVTPTSSLSILQPVQTSSERHSIATTPNFYTTLSSTQSMHLFSSGIPAAATDSTQEHSITTHFPSSTITVVPGRIHCLSGQDEVWGIDWPTTGKNMWSLKNCSHQSGGSDSITGQARRYCSFGGVWAAPDASEFDRNITQLELVERVTTVISQLAAATISINSPFLPSSLDATNKVVESAIDALDKVENITVNLTEFLADVLSRALESSNGKSWMALESDSKNAGSQLLLSNIERVGELLARAQGESGSTKPIQIFRANIAISAKQYDAYGSTIVDSDELMFPKEQDFASEVPVMQAQIQIPPNLVRERLSQQSSKYGAVTVPVVMMLIQNIVSFLPSTAPGLSNTRGVSALLTAQVGARENNEPSQMSPVSLTFGIDSNENSSSHHCVFWNFSNPIGNGSWSINGLETDGVASKGSMATVRCSSTHLTSFAVLVSVGARENTALQVVSYIGCVISILCLLVTIIFFLSHRRELLTTKIHYFIHLNLSLSLLLGYIVFIMGVETAIGSKGGCAFVAALLQYLFLASFCWMLCEGVMLYLMLVLVFTQLKNKWWFFMLLGYLPPLVIVVVSVAIRWEDYGVKDDEDNLKFCWLSTNNGTIAAFIAPMLLIIVINIVFMAFALRVIWKSKKGLLKRVTHSDKEKNSSLKLAKSLLKAAVIFLPLLGLTWVFGVLAVNQNTEFFAWIFTILNSLQGAFFFFFHVIRNEKVLQKIKAFLHIKPGLSFASLKNQYTLRSGSSTIRSTLSHAGDSSTIRSTLSYAGTMQLHCNPSSDMSNDHEKDRYGFEEEDRYGFEEKDRYGFEEKGSATSLSISDKGLDSSDQAS